MNPAQYNINDLLMAIASFSDESSCWNYKPKGFHRFFYEMKERFPDVFGAIDFKETPKKVFSKSLDDHYKMMLKGGLIVSTDGNGTRQFNHNACNSAYTLYTRYKFSGAGSKRTKEAIKEAAQEFEARFHSDYPP